MTTLDWILISVLGAILLGVAIWKIVEFCKLTKEDKVEILKKWLVSAVVAAEAAITTPGAGQEKMKMVLDNFNKNAPVFCKIILATTKTINLEQLIEVVLKEIKESFEK